MFEEPPIEPQLLIRKLVAGVKERVKQPSDKGENTTWTAAVKRSLREIGNTPPLNVDCIYTDTETGVSEFLLDLIWWDRDEGEGASLAMECEWFYGRFSDEQRYVKGVGADFEKLLVFKSPLKLMVFASISDSQTMQRSILEEIKKYLVGYKHHIAGETYLIVDFAPETRAWKARAELTGQNPNMTLSKVDL